MTETAKTKQKHRTERMQWSLRLVHTCTAVLIFERGEIDCCVCVCVNIE